MREWGKDEGSKVQRKNNVDKEFLKATPRYAAGYGNGISSYGLSVA